jgi:hypothetical protein
MNPSGNVKGKSLAGSLCAELISNSKEVINNPTAFDNQPTRSDG